MQFELQMYRLFQYYDNKSLRKYSMEYYIEMFDRIFYGIFERILEPIL